MTAPVTISAADDTHFTLNGRREPRVFVVHPSGNADALIVSTVDGRSGFMVPLGSEVASATPTTQDGLIAALAGVVGGIGGSSSSAVGFESAPRTYGYTGDDLTTEVVTIGGVTYTKTYTYSNGRLISESAWVGS